MGGPPPWIHEGLAPDTGGDHPDREDGPLGRMGLRVLDRVSKITAVPLANVLYFPPGVRP